MAVRITHRRMSTGGTAHEHIQSVKWENPASSETGTSTVAQMVDFIDKQNGKAYTWDGKDRADVAVRKPAGRKPYLQTYADGVWTNNLLALPLF
jgi:Protein of unknown function (DUF3892)